MTGVSISDGRADRSSTSVDPFSSRPVRSCVICTLTDDTVRTSPLKVTNRADVHPGDRS